MDCEYPTHWREKCVKAAREHKCIECGLPIKKGEIHMYMVGFYEELGIQAYRQHVACYDLCRQLNLEEYGECVIPMGGMKDHLRESDSESEHARWKQVVESIGGSWEYEVKEEVFGSIPIRYVARCGERLSDPKGPADLQSGSEN